VRILSRFHPQAVDVSRTGEHHRVTRDGTGLRVDGAPAGESHIFPEGRWRVKVAGAPGREHSGAVTVSGSGAEVAVVLHMALEDHVAAVVAAETEPGTPLEALKALAVVARSFAASAQSRHPDADLCDLAHCQVMGGPVPPAHRQSARAAVRATAGQVLRTGSGAVSVATFHAACGGHTADPTEIFGGARTGAAAVPDLECPRGAWQVSIDEPLFSRVVAQELSRGSPSPGPAALETLLFRRGAGGYVIQVTDGTRAIAGEAFARALDRALGHGRVRSSRFEVQRSGGIVRLAGSGIGHGVGLCQAGAALRAARGQGYGAILRHYFPEARPDPGALALEFTSGSAEPPAPRSAPLSRTSSR
jgi:stage II sporulation protein D